MRTVITPYSLYYSMNSEIEIAFKLSIASMWYLSLIWIWMMVNKASKIFNDTFPANKKFQAFYNFMKSIRKYYWVYLVVTFGMSFYHLVAYEITKKSAVY
jgi:hypothetical protein